MGSRTLLTRVKLYNVCPVRRDFMVGKIIFEKPSDADCPPPDVPGLSSACVKVPNEPVGPGAAKDTLYKNPEYFCYDKNSYFEAEVEMQKFRCPQPSTKVPFKPITNK